MKKYICALAFVLVPLTASAAGGDMADRYFTSNDPQLTPQEVAGVKLAKKWDVTNSSELKPVQGPDGSVKFLFGASRPSIICAVLQVCDIQLQPGEQVNSINLGDSARWTVEPALSGTGDSQAIHLIVKPMDVSLDTSLVVTTNRRTYHLRLKSTRSNLMAYVSFTYPEEAAKKWDVLKAQSDTDVANNTLPQTGEYMGNLNFKYKVDGEAKWKPVRVYNDGKKTILEMPSQMSESEAPTLLIIDKQSGGIFSSDDQLMVNYRVHDNRFIVDSVFDKAILIAGVGDAQNRVTISRGE